MGQRPRQREETEAPYSRCTIVPIGKVRSMVTHPLALVRVWSLEHVHVAIAVAAPEGVGFYPLHIWKPPRKTVSVGGYVVGDPVGEDDSSIAVVAVGLALQLVEQDSIALGFRGNIAPLQGRTPSPGTRVLRRKGVTVFKVRSDKGHVGSIEGELIQVGNVIPVACGGGRAIHPDSAAMVALLPSVVGAVVRGVHGAIVAVLAEDSFLVPLKALLHFAVLVVASLVGMTEVDLPLVHDPLLGLLRQLLRVLPRDFRAQEDAEREQRQARHRVRPESTAYSRVRTVRVVVTLLLPHRPAEGASVVVAAAAVPLGVVVMMPLVVPRPTGTVRLVERAPARSGYFHNFDRASGGGGNRGPGRGGGHRQRRAGERRLAHPGEDAAATVVRPDAAERVEVALWLFESVLLLGSVVELIIGRLHVV
mmetsp:Transcript_38231/g.70592  ORF Transcript_38231/g.70592 Transcript_38231/m.70592 type:complete len:420 (-) Transcript_38231:33-1292(-)